MYILTLAVLPPFQRRGVATQLLQSCLQYGRSRHYSTAHYSTAHAASFLHCGCKLCAFVSQAKTCRAAPRCTSTSSRTTAPLCGSTSALGSAAFAGCRVRGALVLSSLLLIAAVLAVVAIYPSPRVYIMTGAPAMAHTPPAFSSYGKLLNGKLLKSSALSQNPTSPYSASFSHADGMPVSPNITYGGVW